MKHETWHVQTSVKSSKAAETKVKVLQHWLKQSSAQFKDRTAVEYGSRSITYTELDKRTDFIANWLVAKGFPKETFIGILVEDKIALISAVLGILKAGCVFVPLDPTHPDGRLRLMITSVDIKLVITDEYNYRRLAAAEKDDDAVNRQTAFSLLRIIDLYSTGEESWYTEAPRIDYRPGDKIYIYYTSGSTGTPKALLGQNKSLLHFIEWEVQTLGIDETTRVSQLTSPGFDAFLRDVFVPLCTGGVICIPPDKEVISEPGKLSHWLETQGINLVHCVPGVFRLITGEGRDNNQNRYRALEFILLSGEKIEPRDIKDWYAANGERIRLVNLWGTSETTLAKTFYFIGKADLDRDRIPVGKPIKGARVVIMDEKMNICTRRRVGDIYIRTPYRTFGYCNDPELNHQRFIPNPFGNDPADIMHKTGDMGRWLADGNLEVIGRSDRQVKIRGIRIELEEIESLLRRHPGVKEAVVIKKQISAGNDESLIAYVTAAGAGTEKIPRQMEEEALEEQLKNYLDKILPGYMVPSFIITLKEIPRNPNGKVDYKQLPDPLEVDKNRCIPPGNDIEKKLRELWAEVLKIDKNNISVARRFFEMGGNSLNVMSLITKIHIAFDVRISLGEIFNNSTIEKQAKIIQKTRKDAYIYIEAIEEREYYVLSSAQKRLYILQQMETGSIAYNIPTVIMLSGPITGKQLQGIFKRLIMRHESLRTFFVMINEEPSQRIHPGMEIEIRSHDLSETWAEHGENAKQQGEAGAIIKNFVSSFDLSRAPLLRVGIIKTGETGRILMVDMHHIISDGTSTGILMKDFLKLYEGEELPPLKIRYKDFSHWQNSQEQRQVLKNQENYWLKQFETRAPALKLPVDYPKTGRRDTSGRKIDFAIEKDHTRKLNQLAANQDVTQFMVLLAIYNILLSKLSGSTDIVIGTVIEGRRNEELRQIAGMFVNTLALRNYPREDMTFKEFLAELRIRTLNAFENQDYQFDELVAKLQLEREPGGNPLFDAAFALYNFDLEKMEKGGLNVGPYDFDIGQYPFDLILRGMENEDRVHMSLLYSTALFKPSTADKIIKRYLEILSRVLTDIDIQIKDIRLSHELLVSRSSSFKESDGDFGF